MFQPLQGPSPGLLLALPEKDVQSSKAKSRKDQAAARKLKGHHQ